MKARALKKILNDTNYIISNNRDYIAIGSAYVHDLISLNKTTFELKYALDTFKKGRDAIKNEKLELIWDKLQELVDNGEIHDIINGRDIIENPLIVYTVKDGKLIECITDAYGWPNVTDNGEQMYENSHFKTKEEAINTAIKNYQSGINLMTDRLSNLKEEITTVTINIEQYEAYIDDLKNM